MFPIFAAAIGLFFLWILGISWRERKNILIMIMIFSSEVMIIVNIQGVRILREFLDILLSVGAGNIRIGWPVLWSPIQFIAQSFGMKSPFDSHVFWEDRLFSIWIFPVFLLVLFGIIVKSLYSKPRKLTLFLLMSINFIYWLAFLKFRYINPGFVQGEVGNTFLQFKISKWLAPFNLGLLGIGTAWVMTKINSEKHRRIFNAFIGMGLIPGILIHVFIVAKMFTTQFQDEAGQKESPFNVFLDLRSRVSSIPKDQVIYLYIPPDHDKLTQMISYVLLDRKLAGSYDDGYIRGWLPENERDMPITVADWLIQLKPTATENENPLDRVGPFLIRHGPFQFYDLKSVDGGYATETGKKAKWNWVRKKIEYHFRHIGNTQKVKVKFHFLLAGPPRSLSLDILTTTGKRIASFEIPLKGGWGKYESPSIKLSPMDIIIRLSADGQPVRLSRTDSRMVRFLIRNISIEGVID